MISTDQAEQTEDYPSGEHVLQLERGVAPLLLVVLGRKESTGINEDNEEDGEGDEKEFTYQGTEHVYRTKQMDQNNGHSTSRQTSENKNRYFLESDIISAYL